MLSTCDRCKRRDFCENCALQADCYWIKAIPPEGGGGCPVSRISVSIMMSAARLRRLIVG